jgi:hypothetical protein
MGTVWAIYSFPMLVSAFSVGQQCSKDFNCTTDPGSLSDQASMLFVLKLSNILSTPIMFSLI